MSDASPTGAWREALACIDTLLSQPQGDREKYLRDLLQSRPDLHARVQSLLTADHEASRVGFLGATDRKAASSTQSALSAGATLGPYRIVSQLGKGGMGEVWLARRDDGLYQGEVAIKTLHPYFAGGALRDRFLREANLLGRLTHPNIARLLDAGVSEGIVYLVLEYVRGESIDAWCDARKLEVDARLRLFADVCAAVAHAHANLIVHRDIKPSNILVTQDGQVKLLDFGIGKLVETEPQQELTELTRMTGRIFTPEYAAPEQILGDTVTTATDIYSLGVLLHMLLSGTRPYASASNDVDLQRAVLNDDGVAMSKAVAGLSSEDVAIARSTTRVRLQRKLSGDLNHVVARAMRKMPEQRYGSVLALSADVNRFLLHQPVEARAGSNAYRLGRFVRRHRVGVATSLVAMLALSIGVMGIYWQSQVARTEARKATAVKDFLLDIFNANSERHPEGARARQTSAEELVDVASQKVLGNSELEPEVRAELMAVLGNLNKTLEKFEQAEALLRQRVGAIEKLRGANTVELAEPLLDLCGVLRARDKSDEALASAQRAISLLKAAGQGDSLLRGRGELEVAQTLYIGKGGTGANLIDQYLLALRILEKFPMSDELTRAHLGIARVYELARKFDEALVANQRSIEVAVQVRGSRDMLVGGAYQQRARLLVEKQRFKEATESNAQAIDIFSFVSGPGSAAVMGSRTDLGNLLTLQGRYRDAVAQLDMALTGRIAIEGDASLNVQTTRFLLAKALLSVGEWSRTRTLIDAAIQVVTKLQNQNSLPGMLRVRAALALEEKRAADALVDIDRAWEMVQKGRGPRSWSGALTLTTRAETLVALRRVEEARAVLTEATTLHTAITLREANALPTDPRLRRSRELHKKYCTT